MDVVELRARVERFVRGHELLERGGAVTCLVSGGPDSTCLWHVLRENGYDVSAVHVAHGLRGAESEEDARFCREQLGAEVVEAHEAIWSDSTSTGAIAMAEGSIPSVKAIELQGRLLTISGACYGSSPSAEAWILVPIEQWRGPTLTHTQHCQAWDLGQLERGDLRGLVVSWAGRRFVLGALMQLVSPGRPDSHRGTAATGRRAAPKTEQMPLF